jgi:hypothetical protein
VTIEAVSAPEDLAQWGSSKDPFYFELFGETRPYVDTAYAELIPASTSVEAAPVSGASAPVYEYWWTIGHPGLPERDGRGLTHWLHPTRGNGGEGEDEAEAERRRFWSELAEPAARVYLFFPRNGGWRVKEVAATVKYLAPAPQQKDFWEKTVQDWTALQPLVQDAGTLAGALGPQVGVPVRGAVTTLNALAQLKLSSIPQEGQFEWSVGKVTFGHDNPEHPERGGVMQGVVWTLPAKMFTALGGRLTGSLAVSYIPCGLQAKGGEPAAAGAEPAFAPRAILAHAVVYPKDDSPRWMPYSPDGREFVRLQVAPQAPAAQPSNPHPQATPAPPPPPAPAPSPPAQAQAAQAQAPPAPKASGKT